MCGRAVKVTPGSHSVKITSNGERYHVRNGCERPRPPQIWGRYRTSGTSERARGPARPRANPTAPDRQRGAGRPAAAGEHCAGEEEEKAELAHASAS